MPEIYSNSFMKLKKIHLFSDLVLFKNQKLKISIKGMMKRKIDEANNNMLSFTN